MKKYIRKVLEEIKTRELIKSRATAIAQSVLDGAYDLNNSYIQTAIETSKVGINGIFGKETVDRFFNEVGLEVSLTRKNLVYNPDYQIFETEKAIKALSKEIDGMSIND